MGIKLKVFMLCVIAVVILCCAGCSENSTDKASSVLAEILAAQEENSETIESTDHKGEEMNLRDYYKRLMAEEYEQVEGKKSFDDIDVIYLTYQTSDGAEGLREQAGLLFDLKNKRYINEPIEFISDKSEIIPLENEDIDKLRSIVEGNNILNWNTESEDSQEVPVTTYWSLILEYNDGSQQANGGRKMSQVESPIEFDNFYSQIIDLRNSLI